MSGQTTVAAFDFDGTLTTRDTVGGFAYRVARQDPLRSLGRGLLNIFGLLGAVARRDRDRLRAVATRIVFTGVDDDLVAATAATYATDIIANRLRDSTVAALRDHQRQGATTVIVSASYVDYLRHVAEHLGIDAVIGTTLEINDGVCTGELVDGNCRGPEKVRRLDAWMSEHGIDPATTESWAYGDSSGDKEMLAAADHPRWVGAESNSL